MRRIGGFAAAAVLAACGGGSDLAAAESIRLHVEIQPGDQAGSLHTGLLICNAEEARGTGLFDDPAAAARACAAIRSDAGIQRLLLEGRDQDRACTEVYGGPQRARIGGVVDGREVDLRIDRTDGCGIADWERLEPLIGPPPPAGDAVPAD